MNLNFGEEGVYIFVKVIFEDPGEKHNNCALKDNFLSFFIFITKLISFSLKIFYFFPFHRIRP